MLMCLFILVFLFLASFYTYGNWFSFYTNFVNNKAFVINKDYTNKPKVSVVISCFNEGAAIYNSIKSVMESDYPKDKLEILAYDDCSPDDTWNWVQKAHREWPENVIIKRNEVNKGKCLTLCEIAERATGDIFVSIDSDTIVDRKAITEIVACYVGNSDIGAVGGQVRINNLNDSVLSQFQAVQYATQFYFYKPVENQFFTSRCLMGPICSYRREIYLKLLEAMKTRTFLGQFITYGEDTYLTMHVALGLRLEKKWKVWNEINAIGWTGQPATYTTYMNQQMRWRRGTTVNGIFVLQHFFKNCMDAGIAAVIVNTIPTTVTLSSIIFCLYLISVGMFLQVVIYTMLMSMIVGLFRSWMYNRFVGSTDRMGKLKNPVLTGIFSGLWLPLSWMLITFVAVFTLDDPGWVTRQNQGNVR